MRIGLDGRAIGPGATGIGAFAAAAVESLGARPPEGGLVVLARRGAPRDGFPPSASVVEAAESHSLWYELDLPVLLEEEGVGLFSSPLFTCPVVRAARHVVTLHDVFPESHPDLCTPEFLRFWRHRLAPALRSACHAVAVSEWSKSQAVEFLKLAPERVSVVGQCAGEAFRPVPAEEARPVLAKHGLSWGGYVLYTGALDPRKNLGRLVRAFARMGSDDLFLVLAGRATVGGYDPHRFAVEAGVGARVRLLGYVADEDLPALYSGARCFAFPSLAEGFGRPVIEAMACGVPVVASDRTALPETCGGAALLPDAEDEEAIAGVLRQACRDEAVRRRLVEAGRRRAGEFSAERFAADLHRAFRAAAAGPEEGLWARG